MREAAFIGTGQFYRAYKCITGRARGYTDYLSFTSFVDALSCHDEIVVLGPLPGSSFGQDVHDYIKAYNNRFSNSLLPQVKYKEPKHEDGISSKTTSIQEAIFGDVVVDTSRLISSYISGGRLADISRLRILSELSDLGNDDFQEISKSVLSLLNKSDDACRQAVIRGVVYTAYSTERGGSAYYDGLSLVSELLIRMSSCCPNAMTPAAHISSVINSVWRSYLANMSIDERTQLINGSLSTCLFFRALRNQVRKRPARTPSSQRMSDLEVRAGIIEYRNIYSSLTTWSQSLQYDRIGSKSSPRSLGSIEHARSVAREHSFKTFNAFVLDNWVDKLQNYGKKSPGSIELDVSDSSGVTGTISLTVAITALTYLIGAMTALRRSLRPIMRGAKQWSVENPTSNFALDYCGIPQTAPIETDATCCDRLRSRIARQGLNE